MPNEESNNEIGNYRQIMKATSIFGGVQVFNIIISILRSKVIAVLLGPNGIGVLGLLTSTTTLIGSLTNFGLGISAVKNIAAAHQSKDDHQIGKIVSILRKLVWLTGLLGATITFILSPWLSELSFGNKEYTFAFMWLSLSLLFTQLTSGQYVLLQGLRKLKYLAQANMIGSAFGLLVSIPLYYYYQLDGIVPGIIITAFLSFYVNRYYSNRLKIQKVPVSFKEIKVQGKEMIIMGFMLSLSGIMVIGASYIIRIFISKTGGVEDVGYFNAAYAIINTYVGLVFTAMATDYYPRLSGVSNNNQKICIMTNQQADIAILILAPVLMVFIVFIKWIVILLYSTQFETIDIMLHWMALGMFFKAASWSIAFILLAKGASKLFFWNELISNLYGLLLNLLGYYYYGLEGLGVSFLINYILYLIQVFILTKKKFNFKLSSEFYKLFTVQISLAVISFCIITFISLPLSYLFCVPIIVLSTIYSYMELDKRLNLKALIKKHMNKQEK